MLGARTHGRDGIRTTNPGGGKYHRCPLIHHTTLCVSDGEEYWQQNILNPKGYSSVFLCC